MWTETSDGQKFIQEVSREIVTQLAPEEIDLFEELVMEYFQNPSPPDSSNHQKDNPLGFGLEETLIALTPAATAATEIAINYLLAEILKITQAENIEVIKGKLKTLFNGDRKVEDNIPPLTKEQLENIKRLARKQAIKYGIKPEKAEKIANALIGSLALS